MILWSAGLWQAFVGLAFAGPAEDHVLIGQLDREVIALRQKVDRLEGALATCSTDTTPDPIFAELKSVLAGQPAVVTREGARVAITVPLDNFFASDARSMREEAAPLLDLVSMGLKLHPGVRVTVVVYYDNSTIPATFRKVLPTAWELTAWRAAALTRELIDQFGVPATQLTAAGRGDQDPVSTNDTPEGRYLNRRLVLILDPGVPR